MTVEGFKAACLYMKEHNQTANIASTKKNIANDPERKAVFDEVFSDEPAEELTARRRRS